MPQFISRLAGSIRQFLRDESGPTAIEYALLLALIFLVCISAIQSFGSKTNNTFSYIGTSVKSKSS